MIHTTETRRDSKGNIVVEQKYNHLAPAEMMKENNYNQIDGVINNTSKPTFAEQMKAAKTKAQEHNSRRGERYKGVKHRRKSERHEDSRHNEDNRKKSNKER